MQEHHQEAIDRAKVWLEETRPILNAPTIQQKYVINMDQTSLPFSLGSSTTLKLEVAADLTKLKPMIIFKGQRNGTIATMDLGTSKYKNDMVLCCQTNAWQDEENMHDWVDGVLVPHLQEHAARTPVFLFLYQFIAHDTASFRTKMESLGVTLKLIPGKCTWVLQPVDVGIGKPFKDHLKRKWFDCMIDRVKAEDTIPDVTRSKIQELEVNARRYYSKQLEVCLII